MAAPYRLSTVPPCSPLAPAATRLFAGLDAAEVALVARAVAGAERYRLAKLARTVTRLGNGWLYPLLSMLLVIAELQRPLRFLIAASVSLSLAFAIYPALKTSLGRRGLAITRHRSFAIPSRSTATPAPAATP